MKKTKNKKIIDSSQMVPIKAGTFMMGYLGMVGDEKPAHPVRLSAFAIGRYPVTQSFWQKVMQDTDIADPAYFKGENRPIETVSWEDAILFCNRWSELENKPPAYDKAGYYIDKNGRPTEDITRVSGFRLPTEAEWEYAAIGGHLAPQKDGVYLAEFEYAGTGRLEEVGWYDGNSYSETKEVGLKLSNRLGLYDMSGNVWEWCGDWYDGAYYEECGKEGVVTNPLGARTGLIACSVAAAGSAIPGTAV